MRPLVVLLSCPTPGVVVEQRWSYCYQIQLTNKSLVSLVSSFVLYPDYY